MYQADSDGLFFDSEEKPWALMDSTKTSRHVCRAFQRASRMGRAWIVLATSLATKRYDRFCKESDAGVFVMDYLTREESRALRWVFIVTILFCLAYSLSIIHGLDTERFIENYDKWGPSARTCLELARGTISEAQLENKVVIAAKKFANDPSAMYMEADSEDGSHWLFTSVPSSPRRGVSFLRVATPHLKEVIVKAIARIDAAKQVSFYAEASCHPFFRSTFGYIFEKHFYLWLSSDPDNDISCTAWPRSAEPTRPTRSTRPKAQEPAEVPRRCWLRPVGFDKVIVHGGESDATGYKSANKHQTPFCWIPASRSDAIFDAVICTGKEMITIQVTVAAEHTMNKKSIQSLVKNLPTKFRKARSWHHVFVTDHHDNAMKLGRTKYAVADKNKISIHTAVLDISLFQYPSKVLRLAKVPSVSRR
jgi:hypothetical protein